MNDDQRREHAVEACRKAITVWIETDGEKGARALRDSLHALSVCRSSSRDLRERPALKRRKRKAA